MSFINRLEKNIIKKEKAIEKEKLNLSDLKDKLDSNELTRAKYNLKKSKIENKIRIMNSRMRTLKGMMIKEKKHLEEKKKNSEK
jgi:hypothetical protein